MDFDEERERISKFIKTGLVVLTTIAVFSLGIKYVPDAITVTTVTDRKLPIYCVDTDKKQVAISFDAAWGHDHTRGLLDCLKKYKVHATFFLTDGWITTYPDDVKAIYSEGNDLGNHSKTHPHMSKLSPEECAKEIKAPEEDVKKLTGYTMSLFRPPFGDYNNTLISTTNKLGYHCIQWDVDSLDWKDYDAKTICSRVLNDKHLGNGSIILFHNDGKHTLEALPTIIEGLQAKGYELVLIKDLIYQDHYSMDNEGRQHQM